MNRRPWQITLTIAALFVASVLLTGCPKKPSPAAGTGPGTGAGPSAAGGAGTGSESGAGAGGTGGSTPGTIGSGPGGTAGGTGGLGSGPGGAGGAGAGAAGPGVAGATGTTIPALPSPKEFVETSALRDIHFDFDKYEVRAQDKGVLDENAKWLKSNANALLLVEGHCDERGTNEYNLALGERRAKATRDYLVSLGIDGSRITVISYGEERPLCTERTEACWAQNRRAHFLVKQ
ncbi:MAG TPA: peptidoglycan-associated lipoprotein Pal [Methylomirabilota bacterium]|jgi:peptidoglycan-associated lipoprotein|nr:peptidoglycan-associated lipoprotein Pal [Methylomirabilota bacterium]